MAASSSTQLTLHLADKALTPIISSSRQPLSSTAQSRNQAQALSSLTATALIAYETASRLGLGLPERMMIETQASGPIVLHSYINPPSTQRPRSRWTQSTGSGDGIADKALAEMIPILEDADSGTREEQSRSYEVLVNGVVDNEAAEDAGNDTPQQPPLLIASVVAQSAADTREARRSAARLERTGRNFQREWIREQQDSRRLNAVADEEDG